MRKPKKNSLLLLMVLLTAIMTSCISPKKQEKTVKLPPKPVRHELPKLSGEETELELYQKYAYVLSLYESDIDEWEWWAETTEFILDLQ